MANGFLQVTIVLRERLEAIGVEVSVETFEEHQGTAGLGEDLFVSCTMVQSVFSNTLNSHVVRSEAYVRPQEQQKHCTHLASVPCLHC